MKIAFVYDAVYPYEKGGAQKRIWELARRLATDHDVHLYGMHYWDGPSVIKREGVTLHGVCEPQDLYVGGRRSITQALRFALAVTRPLLRGEFDIVDCQEFPYFPCFPAKMHALLGRSDLVVTWYEVWDEYWYEYLGYKGGFGQAVERLTARLPNRIIAISDHIKRDLERIGRYNGVTVVPNGVDFEKIRTIDPATETCDVVYVGRLSEHKNVNVLLEALAVAVDRSGRDIRAKIIGDGPERARLERLTTDLGLDDQVKFLGFIEADEDVIAHLKSGEVFVLPSTREGFPNTILEANACGVPSIVVNHEKNGATAVVEDGETGYVTELDSEAIANRILRILNDSEVQENLQANARQFGKQHDWDVIVGELEDVYLSIAEITE